MAIGLIKAGVRAELSSFDYSEEERKSLSQVAFFAHWHATTYGNSGASANTPVEEFIILLESNDLDEFLLKRCASRAVLQRIANGNHPLYSFPTENPLERLHQFINELMSNEVAPEFLFNYWTKSLAAAKGNEFIALLNVMSDDALLQAP